MLALLIALTFVWLSNVNQHSKRINDISDAKKKSSYVFLMRDAAHRRSIALFRMMTMVDPFDKDDEYVRFNHLASQFLEARDSLLNSQLLEDERKAWEQARPLIREGSRVQRMAVNSILEGRLQDANALLLEKVIPVQNRVMKKLTQMHDLQSKYVEKLLIESKREERKTRIIILTLSVFAVIVGVLITIYVVKRIMRTEKDFIEAHAQAEEANQYKSAFLANMSHEIRTPLTAVIGFAENLLVARQTPVERLSATKTILRNARHLMQIINNVLDLSKIESNKMELDSLYENVLTVFSELDSLIGNTAREKGLDFEIIYSYPLPEKIYVDTVRLRQVLLNLLGNAIKFTEKGIVNLSVSYDQFDDELKIKVEDSGIGMDDNQQARLFSPFEQVDLSTTRKHGGTGLGLAITREFVNLMGGEIKIESQAGVGTRIIVILKEVNAREQTMLLRHSNNMIFEKERMQVSSNLAGHVLVVEDNPDLRDLVSMCIRKTGASVSTAENGKIALEMVNENDFDLILMDIQMPVMDGVEAIIQLRLSGKTTPVIALTANAMKEDKEKYLAIGANDFIPKPIDRDKFNTTLCRFLKSDNQDSSLQDSIEPDNVNKKLDELTARFLQNLPGDIELLKNNFTSNKWEQVCKLTHKLKGLGGSFGYPEITKRAQQIELTVNRGEFIEAENLFDELVLFCGQIPGYHQSDKA